MSQYNLIENKERELSVQQKLKQLNPNLVESLVFILVYKRKVNEILNFISRNFFL